MHPDRYKFKIYQGKTLESKSITELTLDEKMDLKIFASKTNLRQIWRQICPPIKCPKCETNLLSHLSRRNMGQMWFKYAIIFALVQRYLKQDKYEDK